MQNCTEMERYLKNEQLTPSSERKSSRSWTTFLSGVEQRPTSLPLPSAAGGQTGLVSPSQQQQQQGLPVSFTLHRHCSTPSPTASSSPFPLASPSSLGATTPDDDGTNPVDILCFLNIDGVSGEPRRGLNGNGDIVLSTSSSSSSTTSWDSARSDPDVPIPAQPTRVATAPVQQRYVRRPTELDTARRGAAWSFLPRAAAADHLTRNMSNKNAACFRRIAKRRWRATGLGADDVAASPVAGSTSPLARHHAPPTRATTSPVGSPRSRWSPSHAASHPMTRLPPLPSPAEMAYLRSLSGGIGSRTLDAETAKRGSTEPTGARGVQRAATSADRGCASSSLTPSTTTSAPENSRLAAVEAATTTPTTTTDPVGSDGKKQLRIYGCSVVDCGKLYSKSSHLKAHMRSHTGTSTISCRLVADLA